MAGKTLSNGTLSLRFMQNAQRAKLQAQVEVEQAKVKDDAEWSVSQEIRDAWGLGESLSKQEDNVHESSYLPFIFQSDKGEGTSSASQPDGRPAFRGRRAFNAKGKEVVPEPPKPQEPGEIEEEDAKPQRLRSRFEPLPTSISGFSNASLVSTRRDGKKAVRTKTAQELVRESAPAPFPASFLLEQDEDVKPSPASASEASAIPHGAGFVRPAGVDAPGPPGARKRDREQGSGAGAEGKRRKKKREANS